MHGDFRLLRLFFLFLTVGLLSGFTSLAQTNRILIGWDLPTSSSPGFVVSAMNDSSVTANNFGMGTGLNGSNNTTAYGGTSWTAGGIDPIANATVNNDYFYFRVQASPSNRVTVNGISRLVIQVSSSGPKYWHLLYSEGLNTDAAFSSPLRNYGPFEVTVPGSSSTTTDITAAISAAISNNPIVINPSTIGYFRLTGYGGTNSVGSGRVGSANTGTNYDFAILGFSEAASYIPKPINWNGTNNALWSTNSADIFWKDASNNAVSFNTGDTVTFNGNAAVNVDSNGVTVPFMNCSAGTNETQTFTGSPINCQTLLTKSGAGTLIFTPAAGADHSIYEINQTGGTIRINPGVTDSNNDVLGGIRLTMAAGTVLDVGKSSYDVLRQLSGSGTIVMTNLIANTNTLSTNPLVPNNDIHLKNISNSVFSGGFQGSGQVTVDAGTITFAGTNTHTGGTWISNNATLRLSSQASLPAQTQKSLSELDVNGSPFYANGVFEVVDLRLSREDSTGIMGTLELDDSRVTNLVLTNSIGSTRSSGIFRVTAGTNSACTLELNGPINLKSYLSGYNAANGGGYVILRGTNQFQNANGLTLERGGRVMVSGSHCLWANLDIGIPASINFLDTSGYARFGLAPESTDVTLPNPIYANTNSSGTNRHAAIVLSTNKVNGAPQILRLTGVVAGIGGLRLLSPGNGDAGDLYLSSGNTYQGGTRIGTGRILVPSADALGDGSTTNLRASSIGFIRFETRSDSHLVAMNDIDFPTSHSIAVQDDATANLDVGEFNVVLRGFITNFDSPSVNGGHLRKLGSGTLTLYGTNGYTGITRVSRGTLEVGDLASLPSNNRVQFGPTGTLRLAAAGSYAIGSISPVVITNSVGTTNTETMAGVLDLGVSGVNVTVASVPVWPTGSTLRVANLANGSVKLPTSITTDQLAMVKSAENAALYANVDASGNLSFSSTPPVPAGQTFSNWSGGAAITSNLVSKYGIGGATNSSAASEAISSAVGSSTLSITAVVRTNDTKLSVVGEAATGLTNWSTNGVTSTASANTSGVPDGCQRRVFSVNRGTDDKKFLRLKASLQP